MQPRPRAPRASLSLPFTLDQIDLLYCLYLSFNFSKRLIQVTTCKIRKQSKEETLALCPYITTLEAGSVFNRHSIKLNFSCPSDYALRRML